MSECLGLLSMHPLVPAIQGPTLYIKIKTLH
jgi:hypothetical protein